MNENKTRYLQKNMAKTSKSRQRPVKVNAPAAPCSDEKQDSVHDEEGISISEALEKLRQLSKDQKQATSAKSKRQTDECSRKTAPPPQLATRLLPADRNSFYRDVNDAYESLRKGGSQKNPLSSVIPGYTAPMRLQSDLTSGTPDLKTAAVEHTRDSKLDEYARAMLCRSRVAHEKSTGSVGLKGWFNMQGMEMTDELKADMKAVRMRNYIDPKKFYKRDDKFHKFVQVGTVIEGSAEFYSSRLTNKERRGNFVEELMADEKIRSYAKRKYGQLQKSTQNFVRYEKKQKGR